jgi:hypothetical protein
METPDLLQGQILSHEKLQMPFQPRPVFILGIAPRSGTTYLQDLLRVHPDCDVQGLELDEDYFVAHSHLLAKYAKAASRFWTVREDKDTLEQYRNLLCRCLGDGLISYLRLEVITRRSASQNLGSEAKLLKVLVTKTPDVANIDLFFKFFPEADLLILVRDGRAVVESSVRTFYRSFEQDTRKWAASAEAILRFTQNTPSDARYRLVRYEDLYENVESEMCRIMSFLRLDPSVYDFERARNLAVRGSSSFRRKNAEWKKWWIAPGIDWDPLPKTSDFRPLERWSHWNRAQHERFNWLAGKYLAPFGYKAITYSGWRWFWAIYNLVLNTLPLERVTHYFCNGWRQLQFASNKRKGAVELLAKACRLLMPSHTDQEG